MVPRAWSCVVIIMCASAAFIGAQSPTELDLGPGQSKEALLGEWGLSSSASLNLNAWEFVPSTETVQYVRFGADLVGLGGSSVFFGAPIALPTGAAVSGFWVDYCDSNAIEDVCGQLADCPTPSGPCVLYPALAACTSGTPGCGSKWITTPGLVVNNFTRTRFVWVTLEAGDGTTTMRDVIVVYKLQISPAPGTATFSDVPTNHPFFQHIEALASSGITAGCGGGNYCPDAPLTRGQMAVFLAKALGLHWPY